MLPDPRPRQFRQAVAPALKPDGLQRTVLLLALTKPARLYLTDAILAEYRKVLARPQLPTPRRISSHW